jgi:hypothetical protein
MLRLAAATIAALSVAAHPAYAETPRLTELLSRVGANVARFKSEFSLILGVERYEQTLRNTDGRTRARQLLSDVFFYRPATDGPAMTVRMIKVVDGRMIEGSTDRIEQALALPPGARTEKLRALADAGAQYNLGDLQRNFNEPTVALMFGATDFQERFRFSLESTDELGDETVYAITYREVQRPTVIRDARTGADIPASGRLWMTAEGVVKQTELHLDRDDTTVTIRVSYQVDPRLGAMVPATMDEDYRYRDKNTRRFIFVTAHAAYSDYRRFETSVRIVVP